MILLKTKKEIRKMREAGRITALILAELTERVKPGVSAYELDQYAERRAKKLKAVPAFKNYAPPGSSHRYPASLCVSINEEVVHGIPLKNKVIKEGDIVSLDFGIYKDGYYGDAALTIGVEPLSEEKRRLIEVTKKALEIGIKNVKIGSRLSDISAAIQQFVESNGFSVIRDFAGHGIGRFLHEEPQVPNFGAPGMGPEIEEGMTFALEPMVAMGNWEVKILSDGWTAVTADGSLAAHFEHTVAVVDGGVEILTEAE